jgi:hypothetical protein
MVDDARATDKARVTRSMSHASRPLPEQRTHVWSSLDADDRDFVLVEVGKLRDEMTSRMTHQVQLVALLVTGASALVGLALSSRQYILLLVVPIFGLGVGLLHVSFGSYIILIANWIHHVEPEAGYEHFVQSRLSTSWSFRQGNFYGLATTALLLLPVAGTWALFAGFSAAGRVHLGVAAWIGVGVEATMCLPLTAALVLGLRATYWTAPGETRGSRV